MVDRSAGSVTQLALRGGCVIRVAAGADPRLPPAFACWCEHLGGGELVLRSGAVEYGIGNMAEIGGGIRTVCRRDP